MVVEVRLMNAEQSGTFTISGCLGEGTCGADKSMDGDMNTNSVTKLSNRSWWSAQLSNISKVFFTISEIIDYVILLTVCFVFITAYGTTFSTERFPSCPNYHRMI